MTRPCLALKLDLWLEIELKPKVISSVCIIIIYTDLARAKSEAPTDQGTFM